MSSVVLLSVLMVVCSLFWELVNILLFELDEPTFACEITLLLFSVDSCVFCETSDLRLFDVSLLDVKTLFVLTLFDVSVSSSWLLSTSVLFISFAELTLIPQSMINARIRVKCILLDIFAPPFLK